MSVATVFIADDQPPFRAGVASVLQRAGFEVVGEAEDAATTLREVARLQPDVCLLDAHIGGGGIRTVKRMTAAVPGVHVLLLGATITPDDLLAAVRAGANGYLSRSTRGPGLVRAVESALSGQFPIPRAALATFVRELRGPGQQRIAIGGRPISLTEREAQVLELLAEGMNTESIASELGVSPVTVRRHRGAIAAKMGMHGRRELLTVVRAA
jgi:two-component system, NarL family, nitrate/nitrite response regulator NarL